MTKIISTGLSLVTTLILGLGLSGCSGDSSGGDESIGTITSPTTDVVWMDRNLGATMVCDKSRESFTDDAEYVASQQACFGDYYQWGRDSDGHEKSTSAITSTQATDTSNVGHGDFILSDGDNDYDWAHAVDSGGGVREANWNPCPAGFRIPTYAEIDAEYASGVGIANRDDAFNKLGLPSAGYRFNVDSSLYHQGSGGNIWSSGVSGFESVNLNFDSSDADTGNVYRADGLSVRCLKD